MGISIFAASNNKEGLFAVNRYEVKNSQDSKDAKGKKSIFAGDFNAQNKNTIELKRKLAYKRAMKILNDTFASEQDIDNSIKGLKEQQEHLKQEALEDKKAAMGVQDERGQLMERYGVTEDSEEHKELELLRKEFQPDTVLTDSEKEQLAGIHKRGLTTYQKDMMELDGKEEVYRQRAAQKESSANAISSSVTDIELERLKTHPVADATREADEIMEAANKELIGGLWAEAKDHVDEKMEEAMEKAEKEAEEKEEEEKKEAERKKEELELKKRIEESKLSASVNASAGQDMPASTPVDTSFDTTEVHDIIQESSSNNSSASKAEKEIQKLVEELNLIMEDLKGAKIDMNA
ncbi:MAG: hypothetical protein HFH68_17460 [Lachnospiraceae bacterium]|nr:hypothetical protein [Lachnospiraceae bacterium]